MKTFMAFVAACLLLVNTSLAITANDLSTFHCAAFRTWQENRRQALAADVDALDAGVALAQARRVELKALMPRDPRAALDWVVTTAEQVTLPKVITDHLEKDVSGTGYVGVLMADPATETNAVPSASITINGQVLRVFLHRSPFLPIFIMRVGTVRGITMATAFMVK